eukprot:TRINITY_DN3854_c0_g2_i1.p1 TRINITY_DN3854_c0_g2~~TRINITY_DN3854_c0_g2_i1.p1  ORF type:complete len:200 (-),score=44.23 TRINITY_DN3854_c0_g2_i1:259-858(-)
MVLAIVAGDLHIPFRASGVPEEFKELLARKLGNKIGHVLVTGNVCDKTAMEFLRGLGSEVSVTKGEFDELTGLPETKVVTLGQFRVGMTHGHQVVPWGDQKGLEELQRKLDVDVLITGHTHVVEARSTNEGRLLLNPGSMTGSYSGLKAASIPSFLILDVNGGEMHVYKYALGGDDDDDDNLDNGVLVEKLAHHKVTKK